MGEALAYHLLVAERSILEGDGGLRVSARGVEGDFVVGPNHAPFMTMLSAGALEIENEGGRQSFFVSGGFLEISGGRVRILADEALTRDEIDGEALDSRMGEIEEDLALTDDAAKRAALYEERDKISAMRRFIGA